VNVEMLQTTQETETNFYTSREANLRFGDVIKGVVAAGLNMKKSVSVGVTQDYLVDIHVPSFSVILTPCCTVRDNLFTLAPLLQIRNSFFDNPYFREDMTRINRMMGPLQAVAPEIWEKLSSEEKIKRSQQKEAYAFLDLFIYQEMDIFPQYEINSKKLGRLNTRFYMIDFRHLYKISGEEIRNAEAVLCRRKVLQLSIRVRGQLRAKISEYFGRTPEEDLIVEDE